MIIRSQDKKVITRFNTVFIEPITKRQHKGEAKTVGYRIVVSSGTSTYSMVGEYSTEEKAIKVLDMIENAVRNIAFTDGVVFKMPQDSEV